jgi:uncharacterized protein YciI
MAQFMIVAHDGSDADATARRLAARPAHFEGIKDLVARGNLVCGGAQLDAEGRMVGSFCICEFPSRAELDAWLAREPYVKQGVWKRIDVTPIRIAVRDGRIIP